MPSKAAIAKALRLWGDPVVEKASARGSKFGPPQTHTWSFGYEGPSGIELPPDVHERISKEMERISMMDMPPKPDGGKWTQKEVNAYKSELQKPLWDEIRTYAGTKGEVDVADLPEMVLKDFKDYILNETYDNYRNLDIPHEKALDEARKAVADFETNPGPRLGELKGWAEWAGDEYAGPVEASIKKNTKPGYKPPPQFETGKPVTVSAYHGSPRPDIKEFKNEFLGKNTGANSAKLGHFFSGSPGTSDSYVGDVTPGALIEYEKLSRMDDESYDAVRQIFRDEPTHWSAKLGMEGKDRKPWRGTAGGDKPLGSEYWAMFKRALGDPNDPMHKDAAKTLKQMSEKYEIPLGVPPQPTSYPVMINMKNPMVRDWEGGGYHEYSYSKFLRDAQEAGHDSAILRNTYDGGPEDNIFVTFDPTRIRSVNAKFDPENINKADIMGRIDPKLLGAMGAGSGAALTAGALRTGIPDVGTIQGAKSPIAGKIAEYLRKAEKKVPAAGVVLPLEGMANLADKYAYGDPRTFRDYFEANPL